MITEHTWKWVLGVSLTLAILLFGFASYVGIPRKNDLHDRLMLQIERAQTVEDLKPILRHLVRRDWEHL